MSLSSDMCPGCGRPNGCAITLGKPAEECWCMDSAKKVNKPSDPASAPLPMPKGPVPCYCPECLIKIKQTR